jgi:hypothetical protein
MFGWRASTSMNDRETRVVGLSRTSLFPVGSNGAVTIDPNSRCKHPSKSFSEDGPVERVRVAAKAFSTPNIATVKRTVPVEGYAGFGSHCRAISSGLERRWPHHVGSVRHACRSKRAIIPFRGSEVRDSELRLRPSQLEKAQWHSPPTPSHPARRSRNSCTSFIPGLSRLRCRALRCGFYSEDNFFSTRAEGCRCSTPRSAWRSDDLVSAAAPY